MRKYVKTFEGFMEDMESSKTIYGKPSGDPIVLTDEQFDLLFEKGLIFSENDYDADFDDEDDKTDYDDLSHLVWFYSDVDLEEINALIER